MFKVINKKKGISILLVGFFIFSVFLINYTRQQTSFYVYLNADTFGKIIDKDSSSLDNFINGKLTIYIRIISGKIENVLQPFYQITFLFQNGWEVIIDNFHLGENSGKNEANYGESIECDGVVSGPEGSNDNLYFKIIVPTNTEGNIIAGMQVEINIWPTDDAVDAIDGNIYPAGFDNETAYDWWDENDIVRMYLTTPKVSLSFSGYSGARLIGEVADS